MKSLLFLLFLGFLTLRYESVQASYVWEDGKWLFVQDKTSNEGGSGSRSNSKSPGDEDMEDDDDEDESSGDDEEESKDYESSGNYDEESEDDYNDYNSKNSSPSPNGTKPQVIQSSTRDSISGKGSEDEIFVESPFDSTNNNNNNNNNNQNQSPPSSSFRPSPPSTPSSGERPHSKASPSFFAQPGIYAAVVGGAVVGLLCAILFVMFIVYRMRKKDEGSYALDLEPKRTSNSSHSYSKPLSREIYA